MRLSVIGGITVLLAGCSIHDLENPFTVTTNANGKPTVWDCITIQMSSPPRYGCPDNKSYNSFELRNARLGVTPAEAAGPYR